MRSTLFTLLGIVFVAGWLTAGSLLITGTRSVYYTDERNPTATTFRLYDTRGWPGAIVSTERSSGLIDVNSGLAIIDWALFATALAVLYLMTRIPALAQRFHMLLALGVGAVGLLSLGGIAMMMWLLSAVTTGIG